MEDPEILRRLYLLAQHEEDVLNLKIAEHIEVPRWQRKKPEEDDST